MKRGLKIKNRHGKAWFGVMLAMGWILWHPAFTEAGPTAPKDMAWIPPGEFVMGLEGAGNKTPHKVFLDGFFIDKYEVTQEDYESQRGANPSKFTGRKNPVEQVTWYEARAYCAKLGKRLPTEAEWEKAARGGTATLYFWGPEMDAQYAWFDDNSDDQTHPVGGRQPNAYGLHDTSGNVWEWVGDWYEKKYYERSPAKNPKGPESGVDKTLRGGSWYSSGRHLTTATRYWSGPNVRNSNFGFRCAKDAPQD